MEGGEGVLEDVGRGICALKDVFAGGEHEKVADGEE